MLRLDAIRITRVLWFIQFVLDKSQERLSFMWSIKIENGLKISLSFGQIVLAFGQFMSVPPLFENPRTPMVIVVPRQCVITSVSCLDVIAHRPEFVCQGNNAIVRDLRYV